MTDRVWTIVELIRWSTEYLTGKGFHNPRLNVEMLLSGVLGIKRLELYLQFDRPLHPEELAEFKSRLLRRVRREPLQYIEGRAAFRDLELRVDRRVLIPRPETELLVERVLQWIGGREGLRVLDVGTGSGAIALSLATEAAGLRVVATDVSPAALEVARANHELVAPAAPVDFREGAGLGPVRKDRFDVIVSNPPYIATSEGGGLDPEVREWEPGTALFSGITGLEVIEEIVTGAPSLLHPGGLLALEIGASQGEAVSALIRKTPGFGPPRLEKDLAGRDRIVLAELERTQD